MTHDGKLDEGTKAHFLHDIIYGQPHRSITLVSRIVLMGTCFHTVTSPAHNPFVHIGQFSRGIGKVSNYRWSYHFSVLGQKLFLHEIWGALHIVC